MPLKGFERGLASCQVLQSATNMPGDSALGHGILQVTMARLHWYALFVVCSLTIDFGIATPDPSEVFSINLSGEGSCSKYHDDQGNGQLDNVLAETQEIIHSTSTLVDGNYQTDWNYKARYLAASLFGLDPGPDNEEPSTGLDGEKLSKIRGRRSMKPAGSSR